MFSLWWESLPARLPSDASWSYRNRLNFIVVGICPAAISTVPESTVDAAYSAAIAANAAADAAPAATTAALVYDVFLDITFESCLSKSPASELCWISRSNATAADAAASNATAAARYATSEASRVYSGDFHARR